MQYSPEGITYYDGNTFLGTALDEICTEKASMRTTSSKITPRNYLKTSGYSRITPILNLLVAATGVSEKQLLKASSQGRKKFMKVIYSQFPESVSDEYDQDIETMFTKFETTLDVIYNTLYGDKKTKKQILASAFQGIEEVAFELAEYQMKSDKTLTPAEKAYRFRTMESIIQYLKKTTKIKYPSTNITQDKKKNILSMEGVQEAITNPDHKYEHQRFYEEHGTKTNWKDSMFLLKLRFMKIQKTIFSIFPEPIQAFLNRGTQKRLRFSEKLKNQLKLLTNRNTPKLLDSGKDNNDTKNINLFFEGLKVRPEDLMPIGKKYKDNEEIMQTQPQYTEKHDSKEVR